MNTPAAPETIIRRWKITALAAVALLVGYGTGSFLAPTATAQQTVTKVQLDTTNCRNGADLRGDFSTLVRFLPRGAILTAVIPGRPGEVTGIYYVCD